MLRMIHIHYVRGKCCLFIAEEMSLYCIYIVFLTVFCIQRVLENSVFVRIYNESILPSALESQQEALESYRKSF